MSFICGNLYDNMADRRRELRDNDNNVLESVAASFLVYKHPSWAIREIASWKPDVPFGTFTENPFQIHA